MRPNPRGTPGPGRIPPQIFFVVRLRPPRIPIPAQSHPFPSPWPVDAREQIIEGDAVGKIPAAPSCARGGGDARARLGGGGGGAGEEGRTKTTASTTTPPSGGGGAAGGSAGAQLSPLQRPPTAATADTRKAQGRPAATATWSSPLRCSSPSVTVFLPVRPVPFTSPLLSRMC
jgi:hypothetical protein